MRSLHLAFALATLALGSCVTPSIPIPPPSAELMVFSIDATMNTARFTYPANPHYEDAIVFVFNRDTGSGVIERTRDDGSVGPTAPLGVHAGDQVVVSFQREDQTVSTCIRVRDGAQDPNTYCD